MQSKLHRNVVYHSVEVLLFASMLVPLAIPKSLLILKEFWNTSDTNFMYRIAENFTRFNFRDFAKFAKFSFANFLHPSVL